jgi:putative peptidoglycan lipid II flippase
LEYALALSVPAAVALIVVPRPIVAVLFGHGRFDPASVVRSSQSLAAFAIGLPAFVLVKVLSPGFFARHDTATPVKVGGAAVALNLGLNLLFMVPLQHVGPALASSIAGIFNTSLLAWLLMRRGQLEADRQLRSRLPRIVAAACLMGAALFVAERLLYAPLDRSTPLRALGLAMVVSVGGAAYFTAGQVLGAFDLREFIRPLRRRRAVAG